MRLTILDAFTASPGDLSWSDLESLAHCSVHERSAQHEIIERAKDCELILTNKTVLNEETIHALPKLRYIGVLATGYNIVDTAAAKARGITVTNVPGYSTASVAQATFALIHELATHTGHHARTVREGRWASCRDFCYWDKPLTELSGMTLGLFGFGEIGAAVARIGVAMGMEVMAHRRSWKGEPPDGVTAVSQEDLFVQSDVLSLHCPLTAETREIISAKTLGMMKSTALLINTSRGPLIHETELAHALNNGTIAGAGLDVLSSEPPQASNPLLTAKNCVITPHIAWATKQSRSRLINIATENVRAFLKGAAQNVVA